MFCKMPWVCVSPQISENRWHFDPLGYLLVTALLCFSFECMFSQTEIILYHLALVHGEGDGTPHQYCCLENPMDGGAWWAAVHGVAKSRTRLSDFTFTFHLHALEKEMATHSCSCLENPRDGGAWWAAIYGVAQSRTQLKRLSSSSSSM